MMLLLSLLFCGVKLNNASTELLPNVSITSLLQWNGFISQPGIVEREIEGRESFYLHFDIDSKVSSHNY